MIAVREATLADAEGMSAVLQALIASGKRRSPGDIDFVKARYLNASNRIRCSVALDGTNQVLGFQSLKRADADNPYDTPVGWGIIGTHIHPDAARKGIGATLFRSTRDAAQSARLPAIEAFIGSDNAGALGYYEAMGFRTYRHADGVTCKAFSLG